MSGALDGRVDLPGATAPVRRRADPTGRGTATLPELRRLVENQFLTGFSHRIWLTGEVDAPEEGRDGGLHFDLVALDGDEDWLRLPCDIPAESLPELRGLLQRVSDADLDDVVAPGRTARVGGLLRYDFRVHRLALAVSAVDPATTAQALADARAQAREEVLGSGLARHQRRLAEPVAPVHVALVGGVDDPALQRAADRLRSSGYAVDLRLAPAVLTGAGASARVAEALARVAGHSDLVLLVRGEGRELELAAFDGDELARAVAATPVPVVAGLGGRGERTVCDEVAAESLPTADAAVDHVLTRLDGAFLALGRWRREVRAEAEAALDRARGELEAARAAVEAPAAKAAVRAEEAHRRRWRGLLVGAGVAAAGVVVVAVALGSALPLLLLLAIAAVLGVVRWGTTGSDRRGSSMVLEETGFARVLERLERIRDELVRTSNPETVQRLHDEARQLVERGEQVLGRGLEPAPARLDAGSGPGGSSGALPGSDPLSGSGRAGLGRADTTIQPAPSDADAGADDTVATGSAAVGGPAEPRGGSGSPGDETTSLVVLPAGRPGATPSAAGPAPASTGDDVPTQRHTALPPAGGPAGDADTTQVLPTTGR